MRFRYKSAVDRPRRAFNCLNGFLVAGCSETRNCAATVVVLVVGRETVTLDWQVPVKWWVRRISNNVVFIIK